MRILQIVADGSIGGGTTFVLGLMEDLKAQKNAELFFITQKDSYALQEAKKKNIQSVGIDIFSYRLNLFVAWRLLKEIRKIKPDVIHVHGGRAAFFVSLLPLRFLYTPHGLHFANKKGLGFYVGKLAEIFSIRRAKQTIFICNHDKNLIKKDGPVIHNGIDVDHLSTKPKKDKSIVFIGRLVEQKDPHLAMEVAQLLKKDGFHLTMIGGGPLYNELKNDGVTLTGPLPREQALAILAEAQVLLLTSRWEGLPLVVLEAMAMETVVVAADVCGVSEVIEHGKTGYLVKERDPQEYTKVIKDVYNDQSVKHNARLKVEKDFSRKAVSQKYWDRYCGQNSSCS